MTKFVQKLVGGLFLLFLVIVLVTQWQDIYRKDDGLIPPISSADHPNVLLIIVDDLKPLINAYGQSQMVTPNIDMLSKKSAIFTNAHSQQALCSPSRVSFLTGMRPDYTRVWDLVTLRQDKVPSLLTLPEFFKNQGYETVGLGKVFHNREDQDYSFWTTPFHGSGRVKFSKNHPPPVFHHRYQNEKSRAAIDAAGLGNLKDALKKAGALTSVENEDVADDAYMDGAITLKALRLIKRLGKKERPFFMTVGFRKPHLPFIAPRKYWELYNRDEIKLSTFQSKAKDSPNLAYHRFGELTVYSDIQESMNDMKLINEAKQRELIHGYYACVSYIDAQVGLLMTNLKKLGLDENTVVILMGDHGWHLGDHGIWCKHSNFEQATRTPLIIHSPNIKNRISNNSPVELLDVFPTICDLTNLEKPNHLQGKSLVPILRNQSDSVKSFALSQYPRGKHMGYALRTKRYRYIEWHLKKNAVNGVYDPKNIIATELYDYEVDPNETRNIINNGTYVEISMNLKKELEAIVISNRTYSENSESN